MCTEPLYAIRLKTEFDRKFQRFGKRTPIKILRAVKEIGKDTSKLDYNRDVYDLLMISCGQCLQCRMQRVKQRAVMSICESLDHQENSFITLTFGFPQTYAYYRHPLNGSRRKPLSHYLAKKKAHFHEWSLEVVEYQKFMKRLRNWYYNYQLCHHFISIGRSDLIPETYPYVTHIRLPLLERPFLLKDFHPKKIRCMHCGEYGSSCKHRPHHHAILFGFQFPDLKEIYEDGKKYYTSDILSKLWPFGIHRIGDCTYNSCAYVSRYVTKKINGNNQDQYYEGRKPEYVTYSTKPVLGSNYFKKNYKEFVNTGLVSVVAGKLYECPIPKSYDNIVKKLDINLYNTMKEKRVKDCKKSLDDILSQDRSIYSKLDSNKKICLSVLRKLVRSYEASCVIDEISLFKKAKAFGINVKFFASEFKDNAVKLLQNKTYKHHKSRNSNDNLHEKYYKFELARKRHISHCYDLNLSDKEIVHWLCFYKNMPNPYKSVVNLTNFDNEYLSELHYFVDENSYKTVRGRSLPDIESINEDSVIDEKGKEYIL